VVPDFASQIAELEKDPVKNELLVGNLEPVRDYLDVRDVVAGYKSIIDKNWIPGDSYNICSGKGIKIKEILEILLRLANKKLIVREDPSKLRSSDTPVYVGNNQKFIKLTGWKPKITMEQTLKDSLDFWRK
jgi:GDP-4-dehydro-6-deoxy-D-mannose reductase